MRLSSWLIPSFRSEAKQLIFQTAVQIRRHDLPFLAASLAFYSFLALIPLTLLVVLTYGLIAEPTVAVRHVRFLAGAISSDLGQALSETVMKLALDTTERKGIGVIVSLIVALYAGVRGARALTKALDTLHETECKRSFLKATAVSGGIVIASLLVATAALIAIVALGYLEEAVAGISPAAATLTKLGTWFGAAALVSCAISALYRYAPSVSQPLRHKWWSAGAVIATIGWCLATALLGIYVANFSRYDAVYGSAATIVVLLMWFYISCTIVLAGAEIDIALNKQGVST